MGCGASFNRGQSDSPVTEIPLQLEKGGGAEEVSSKSRSSKTSRSRCLTSYDAVHMKVIDNIFSSNENRGLVGLCNLGNTCFMNSALQCLSNTVPLSDYFLGYNYKSEINKQNPDGMRGEIAMSYGSLVQDLWKQGSTKCVTPKLFKGKISKFAPQFSGYDQQDSHELIMFLLDGLHEDLNRVGKKKFVEDVEINDLDGDLEGSALKAWSGYLERNKSIVVDLFQGQLRNTMKCRNANVEGGRGCGHCCIKFESFMYLTLPIGKSECVEDCIAEFCKEEMLDGDNQWYCNKCKAHVRAEKKYDLWKLPPVLIISCKRFEYDRHGRGKKVDKFISTPIEDFDLTSLVESKQREPPLYDLYAVSNHHGAFGGGHYTAYCKNRINDNWYHYNDEQVSQIDEREVEKNQSAYVLFYNRVVHSVADDGTVSDSSSNSERKRAGIVRRQSVSMPHLWPHNLSSKPTLLKQRKNNT